MDRTAKLGFAGLIFFALVFAQGFLLSASGMTLELLSGFDLGLIASVLFSEYFLGFAILLPLPHALASVLSKKIEQKELTVIAVGGSAIGMILALLFFPNLSNYLIACILYIVSFVAVIEISFIKRMELKKWIWLRTLSSASRKGLGIVTAGLFIAMLLFTLPNNEANAEKFQEQIFDMALSQGSNTGNLSNTIADLLVENQKQTLNTVVNNPLFKNIKDKQDTDVQLFVAAITEIEKQIDSPAYSELVKQQIDERMNSASGNKIDIQNAVKSQFPLFGIMLEWLWLIQTLSVVGLFALYKGLIATPLGIAYGLVLEKAIK